MADESFTRSSLVDAVRRGQATAAPSAPDQADGRALPLVQPQPSTSKHQFARGRVRKPRRGLVLLTFALALVGLAVLPNGPFVGVMSQANSAAVDLARTNPTVYDALGLLGLARVRAAVGLPPICEQARPIFLFGFGELKVRVGDKMGQPLECERAIHPSGDTQQRTTTGLAYYRKGVNIPTFTNGSDHWALTYEGLVYWIGDVVDPPTTAVASLGDER